MIFNILLIFLLNIDYQSAISMKTKLNSIKINSNNLKPISYSNKIKKSHKQ